MTAVLVDGVGAEAPVGESPGFDVGYVGRDGVEVRASLAEVQSTAIERCLPVRRLTPRKGQRHLSGLWWSATTGGHVGYESWLERDQLMRLDQDRSVVGIASQPLWLYWADDAGRTTAHAPDYFVRRDDGGGEVIDCRPVGRRRPEDLEKFDATARACAEIGWRYRLLGALDPVLAANMRWLAGYRHPRFRVAATASALLDVCGSPVPLMTAASSVGDPIGVLPVLFHLVWAQELTVDLAVPLRGHRVVTAVGGVSW